MAIKMKYKPQKMVKLKAFFSIVIAVFLLVQIGSLSSIVQAITVDYRKITLADMDNLKDGELVQGIISGSDAILKYQDQTGSGTIVYCLGVMTENRKVIAVAANPNIAPEAASQMAKFSVGGDNSLMFRGKVGKLTFTYRDSLMLNMTLHNTYYQYQLNSNDVTWMAISLVDNDSARWTALLIASILGMIALLAILWFLLRKSINNIIYGLLVQKGVLEPEIKITKDDINLENMDPYQSNDNDMDSFYVNTDFETGSVENGYKFSPDQSELDSIKMDTANMNYKNQDSPKDNNDNPVRNFLASNSFIASSGVFGLVGHDMEKANQKPEEIEFYQSGVNEDGNFFVDRGSDTKEDIDGEQIHKY